MIEPINPEPTSDFLAYIRAMEDHIIRLGVPAHVLEAYIRAMEDHIIRLGVLAHVLEADLRLMNQQQVDARFRNLVEGAVLRQALEKASRDLEAARARSPSRTA